MNSLLAAVAAALILCFTGMAGLSLAMDRHHQQVTGKHEIARWRRLTLRSAGTLLLMGALWLCMAHWGASIGVVAWCGFLTLGATGAAVLLAYRPDLLQVSIAGAIAVLALLLLLL